MEFFPSSGEDSRGSVFYWNGMDIVGIIVITYKHIFVALAGSDRKSTGEILIGCGDVFPVHQ